MRKNNIAFFTIIGILACGFALLCSKYSRLLNSYQKLLVVSEGNYRNLIGRQFVDFCLEDIHGNKKRLSEIASPLKIGIIFNTLDCGKCLQDYRVWNAIFENYKDISLFGINDNADISDIAGFIDRKNVLFPIFLDSDSFVKKSMGISVSPLAIIMDRRNTILDVVRPGEGSSKTLLQRIEAINSNQK